MILIHMLMLIAAPHTATADRTPPCTNDEPSIARCVWDARHMGNGGGRSFLTHDDRIIYISHARAHRLMTTNR